MAEIEIPNSFDDFFKDEREESNSEEKKTIEDVFAEERSSWTIRIKELSARLKKIENIPDLEVDIYTERERAVERYHYIISLLIKVNKRYKKQYAEKYDFYTNISQIRYPNETVRNNKILSELSEIVSNKESLENHSKAISQFISTIDNIIYGIKYRVEVEQIMRGK